MASNFYDIPGSHKPSSSEPHNESTSLLPKRKSSLTYFSYKATPQCRKISSRHDPANPNRDKLGTYGGVFVPTALNVLSILMFLRFGFILGQLGIICTLGLLLLSYLINLLTTLSISAISTNGTVRGGGAYYMISRSLGPEFGGSIGLVFFFGQVFNSGMNAIGLVEPLLYNLGISNDESRSAALFQLLPKGHWHEFIYATVILLLCLSIALVGSQTVSRAGNILFLVLVLSIASIPLSALIKMPFSVDDNLVYSGISWKTFTENLYPHLTKGAAGSVLKSKETFNDLFGIFFPATAGIFAGAGMSSELRKPSRSIPKGTLWGLLFTFLCYTIVVISMSFTIPRQSLYGDVQVIQSVSAVQWIIFMGEMSTALFSIIVGMVGAAYVLEAISRDSIIPGITIFHKKPLFSLLFTWFLTQLCLFSDVNKIATFITMTFLMTFAVMNLACFLLELSSAPNFRPSFKYFDRYTAISGAIMSTIAMFVVDGISASGIILAMVVLFLMIHYFCPPKSWGDVSQSLIYHQVRKYLLRLRQDNIKYWRPQILLLVDNPRTSWKLIRFCNHLKKGGLYILGHVTVITNFQDQLPELKKQQRAWLKIRELTKIKAFVQIGTGPTLSWGIRNVFLGSGLGGMKPNITVVGMFDLQHHREFSSPNMNDNDSSPPNLSNSTPTEFDGFKEPLPTDECKNENKVKVQQWVQIVEDLSSMQSNIAVAHGFRNLNLPKDTEKFECKRYIDLYPIQMCAQMKFQNDSPSVTTTNFDTYTLILQLGAILVTVPQWKHTHTLRTILFVEKELDRSDEIKRMENLLGVLRIEAEVLVVSLDQFRVYNTIVKGDPITFKYVNEKLKDDSWWKDLVEARDTLKPKRRFSMAAPVAVKSKDLHSHKHKLSKLHSLGISLTMSSSMPQTVPITDLDSDDDTDVGSVFDSSASIPSLTQRLNYETNRRKNHAVKAATPLHKKIDDSTAQSLRPVFSSNKLPVTKVLEDGSGDKPTLVPIVEPAPQDDRISEQQSRNQILPELSPCCSKDSLVLAMNNLAFNDLPSRAQHLVLNDIMTQLSSMSDLIFSTLPIPALGTHDDADASLLYIEDLDTWLEGLPPTMLINSQTMTVTTAL
ncbi:hypothetical protein HG535_0B01520 [Zygotorulaspora mrakii]|uniref:Amino acid permease/ SLC12A domain-containing protein n=1 Tax=Zygotorulaspora mrakii TaxID=42260 RepID=A0A7H9AYB6_ZYGMR|nr:uncharacterized protein HG535_0B01520 [Zygotorulaspora mrakii]QLG71114.1 hypothetical protein HG535_0B01520 [Zygotorulaspora mrakii]